MVLTPCYKTWIMTKEEQAKELIDKYGTKELALSVCKELSDRLPNINLVPPIDRLSDDNYMQYWRFTIPHEVDIL